MFPLARSVIAVVAGFLIIGALAMGTDQIIRTTVAGVFGPGDRVDSVPWLLFFPVYVLVYAVFGCWLRARLAPSRPMRHALILGVLGLVLNTAGSAAMWETAPAWYHIVAIALVMPVAWVGGRIRERQLAGAGNAFRTGGAISAR